MLNTDIRILIYLLPAILISFTFHELAHAITAYKLGDPTPKMQGRLTLNPLKHLDPIGTLLMLVAYFGWAKPVEVNPRYFRDPDKGMMLVSISGPIANIIMACIGAVLFKTVPYLNLSFLGIQSTQTFRMVLFQFSYIFWNCNIFLAIFNLLPIPPLDGAKILSGLLPPMARYKFMEMEKYLTIVFFLVLIFMPSFLRIIINPFISIFSILFGMNEVRFW